jgi:ribosomal protein S18 acetylase RimI-like enzyme
MKYKINIIDNLFNCQKIDSKLPQLIFSTIMNAMSELGEATYIKEDMDSWLSRRSLEEVEIEIKNRLFIYFTNDNNNIIAFAALYKNNGKYHYSWLQVLPEYRQLGLAHKLYDLFDNYLKLRGVSYIVIESMKFQQTLKFHEKRGFKIHNDQIGLTETVRMYSYI